MAIKVPMNKDVGIAISSNEGIEKIKTKLTRLGYSSPFDAFSRNPIDSLKNNIPKSIKKVISNVFSNWFNI